MVIGRMVPCEHGAQENRCPACLLKKVYEERIKALEDRLEALDGITTEEVHVDSEGE